MGVHALYTAATGMDAQLKNIDVIANNLANVSTVGFRRDRANFEDLFYQHQALAGATGIGPNPRPSGINIGHGVRLSDTQKIFQTMPPIITDEKTDVAIQDKGNHFFQIEMPDGGIAFTRAGNFHLSAEGRMVTAQGYPLEGVGALPEGGVLQVENSGEVFAKVGREDPVLIGQITLARFINPSGLTPRGENLFDWTAAAGERQDVNPAEFTDVSVLGGAIEGSNVSAIRELIQLIQGQRAYEVNSNVIKTSDEALQIANNLRS